MEIHQESTMEGIRPSTIVRQLDFEVVKARELFLMGKLELSQTFRQRQSGLKSS